MPSHPSSTGWITKGELDTKKRCGDREWCGWKIQINQPLTSIRVNHRLMENKAVSCWHLSFITNYYSCVNTVHESESKFRQYVTLRNYKSKLFKLKKQLHNIKKKKKSQALLLSMINFNRYQETFFIPLFLPPCLSFPADNSILQSDPVSGTSGCI